MLDLWHTGIVTKLVDETHYTRRFWIQVPDMEIAGWHTGPVWFASRKDRMFHEAIATLVDQPLDGALGGNAFASFRITADYPSAKLAFEQLGKSGG